MRTGVSTLRMAVIGAVAAAMWAATPAAAVTTTITTTNYDSLSNVGSLVDLGGGATSVSTPLMTADLTSQGGSAPFSLGSVLTSVYLNASGVYTYVMKVTPAGTSDKEFNTGFVIDGFTGVAGYSFADATADGATGALGTTTGADRSFSTLNVDGRIDWTVYSTAQVLDGLWNNASKIKGITFFYQSTSGPGSGTFNFMASQAASGTGVGAVAPVPEPASLFLLGSGAIGAGMWLRRRRARLSA